MDLFVRHRNNHNGEYRMIKKEVFKSTGGFIAGCRLGNNGIIECKELIDSGLRFTKAMKNKKEYWTIKDCPNQIKRLTMRHGDLAIADKLDITLAYLKQLSYGFAMIKDEFQTMLNRIEKDGL